MAALAHPHVLTIHDAGRVNGSSYLIMEYAPGGSLRARMTAGRPWPLAEAAQLLDCVARALEHIHAQGILHLDLKPENILYAADGQIKITDFGLSVPHAGAGPAPGAGHFGGTPDYCPPEVRAGLALDERCDVFALATLAYELLTGHLPGRVYVPASRRNPRLPAALDEVLRRGLVRDPDKRYPSVAVFRQALADACRQNASSARGISLRLLGVLTVLVALVVLPLVAYKWRPGAQHPNEPPAAPDPREPGAERPDRLVILYASPDDLALFAAVGGGELASGSAVPVERVLVGNTQGALPAGLPLSAWLAQPTLVLRSPGGWGFVYPLRDPTLAQRVVKHWPDLARMVVPNESNFVKAGRFDGPCLAPDHEGNLWRAGSAAGWNSNRGIELDARADRTDNPALRLTNLDPAQSGRLLGAYQPLAQGPSPGEVVVLRYRARALRGKGSLAVYAGLPVAIPQDETGPIARRVRAAGMVLTPEPGETVPNWLYRCPNWVVPTDQWLTYLVVCESPPFPARRLHCKLVIDLTAMPQAATDQVWVDDVELFVWRPEIEP
jgi:hypothetical protein